MWRGLPEFGETRFGAGNGGVFLLFVAKFSTFALLKPNKTEDDS